MRLRTGLLRTIVIQGTGASSMFLAVIFIGIYIGPEQQGVFSRIKSEIEFIGNLSFLGLPQALFFYYQSGQIKHITALRLILGIASVSMVLSIVYVQLTQTVSLGYCMLFALAVTMFFTHGTLRVLTLSLCSSMLFSFVTAAPQFTLFFLICVGVFSKFFSPWQIVSMFLIAFLIGSLIAWKTTTLNELSPREMSPENSFNKKDLLSYSLASWCTATLGTAITLLWIRYIESEFGLSSVGLFTMGLLLIQLISGPFNYAVPVLSKYCLQYTNVLVKIPIISLLSGLGVFAFLSIVFYLASLLITIPRIGIYSGLFEIKWALAVAASAEIAVNIAAVGLNAKGHPWIQVAAMLLRIVLFGTVLAFGTVGSIKDVINTWAIAAVLSACFILMVDYSSLLVKFAKRSEGY